MSKVSQSLFIKAEEVEQYGPGLFRIVLASQELTDEERVLLNKLYPHLQGQAYELLSKEALLDALTEPPQSVEAGEKKHKKISKPYTPDDSIATKATY